MVFVILFSSSSTGVGEFLVVFRSWFQLTGVRTRTLAIMHERKCIGI